MSLNVESDKFSLVLNFLGFFCLLVSCVLDSLLLFFFFYSCFAAATRTTTITSSSASKGEGASKTSYKLWSYEFWSFRRKKEQVAPKLVLLLTLGLGSTHTHPQGLIAIQDLHQVMQPHIHLLSLYMGIEVNIWVMHSCVFLSLQSYSE
jgi:hypothetical protein